MTQVTDGATFFAPIDCDKNQVISVFGIKGSGKSTLANVLQRNWRGVDKLTVDISGDDRPSPTSQLVRTPPASMPRREEPDQPIDLWFVPDAAAPTYRDDLDRGLRAGLFPRDRRKLVTIHEVGEVLPAGQTPPHGRLLVQQGRHYNASAILCGPRPMDIEPLALTQADEVFMYPIPNPNDRRRLADTLGLSPRDMDAAFDELDREPESRDGEQHHFLRFIRRGRQLLLCDPLPDEWIKS